MRYLIISAVVLAGGIAQPEIAVAQQPIAVDSQTRQQVEAVVTQYLDAMNKGDTKALGGLYAPNAIDINPFGVLKDASTQFEIAEKVHKMGLVLKAKIDDVEPAFGGQAAIAAAPYTSTFTNEPAIPPGRGNKLFVLEHTGDSWKIRALTASRLAPSPPPK